MVSQNQVFLLISFVAIAIAFIRSILFFGALNGTVGSLVRSKMVYHYRATIKRI